MKSTEFPFVIGYTGNTAIFDKKFKGQFDKKTAKELTDEGQFKAAFCLAIVTNSDEDKDYIALSYNKLAGSSYSVEDLSRLFGVFDIPSAIVNVRAL